MGVLGEGWKTPAYKMNGRTKSRGVKPKEPITALMSPKNGIAALMSVVIATSADRRMRRGTRFRAEYLPFCIFDDLPSKISKVGCAYTCKTQQHVQYFVRHQSAQALATRLQHMKQQLESDSDGMLWELTKATARSCASTRALDRKLSHLGTKGSILMKIFPWASFPNAQYPAAATEKNVVITTA